MNQRTFLCMHRLFFSAGQRLVLQAVDQQEDQVSTQAYRRHVDGRIDVPAKPPRELLEHDDGRFSRPNKEHIHVSSQAKLHNAVEQES